MQKKNKHRDPESNSPVGFLPQLMLPQDPPEEKVDILLVDDHPDKLLALEAVLSDDGQNVIKASSGKEALRLLLKKEFALILLDVNMPGMDGLETAALIRQRKSCEKIPIIFVTAVEYSEASRITGYSLGAVDYIFSPIIPEVLKAKVAVFVDLYRKTKQVNRLNKSLTRYADQLEKANQDLQGELGERLRIEAILKQAYDDLELRVQERTRELSLTNQELKREIQEREETEKRLHQANVELRRLNDIKSEFTSMVSHELRTPLAAIKEGIDLILDGIEGDVTDGQRETLAISKANVDRLARLIQNVLDYSKLESGKMEMFFDKVNVCDLLNEVFSLMNPVATKKNISFRLDLPKAPTQIYCDSDKIKQLMINLIDNAIKFTGPQGQIDLRLKKNKDELKIELQDTGVGIKASDLDKIFEMFNQGSGLKVHRTGGAGVGLAVCKLIAKEHSGSISVQSQVGQGSLFSITLPRNIMHLPARSQRVAI